MILGKKSLLVATLACLFVVAVLSTSNAQAGILPFSTTETGKYLIIGTGPVNDTNPQLGPTVGVGTAHETNNFELGANKAPVASTSDFLDGGNGGGPDLHGNIRPLPSNMAPVFRGIGGHGNIAITSVDGTYNMQDVGVYADLGIHTRAPVGEYGNGSSDQGTSNSAFYNSVTTDFSIPKNNYPNTFDPAEWDAEGGHAGGAHSGQKIDFNDVDSSNVIDDSQYAGVTGSYDFTNLLNELYGPGGAKDVIPTLGQTATLNVASGIGSGGDGEIKDTDHTVSLSSGLNVIDIVTGGGKDFKLDYANLVIDGPADAFAIFRVPDDANMLMSNSSLLVGDGGIGLTNVVFYTDKDDNNQHFNFSNTVLNGISFWSLGEQGGEININNSQGCVQLVADKINLNDVRFNRCALGEPLDMVVVPEPSTYVMAVMALLGLGFVGYRRRRR